jgi:hypothetical protein
VGPPWLRLAVGLSRGASWVRFGWVALGLDARVGSVVCLGALAWGLRGSAWLCTVPLVDGVISRLVVVRVRIEWAVVVSDGPCSLGRGVVRRALLLFEFDLSDL